MILVIFSILVVLIATLYPFNFSFSDSLSLQLIIASFDNTSFFGDLINNKILFMRCFSQCKCTVVSKTKSFHNSTYANFNEDNLVRILNHQAVPAPLLVLMTFAGTPTAMEKGGISLLTTAPAPMTLPLPIVTPSKILTPEPIQHLS